MSGFTQNDNVVDVELVYARNKVISPLAKLSHKLTKESDYFLGQKVIEARMLGGKMDVWYKLGENIYA